MTSIPESGTLPPPRPSNWKDIEERGRQAAIADCPTPVFHTTHRYCPSCPWTEPDAEAPPSPLVGDAPDTSGIVLPDDGYIIPPGKPGLRLKKPEPSCEHVNWRASSTSPGYDYCELCGGYRESVPGPTELHYAQEALKGRLPSQVLMDVARDSGMLPDDRVCVGVLPYLVAPHWFRNGRECGAWAAGAALSLVGDDAGFVRTIHVQMKPEHVDGAAGALLDAGFRVERYSSRTAADVEHYPPGEQSGPSVTLAVTRTEP